MNEHDSEVISLEEVQALLAEKNLEVSPEQLVLAAELAEQSGGWVNALEMLEKAEAA